MSHLLLIVVTGVVSSTVNVTSTVQCGESVCETDEVCEHILLVPTCRKTIGAVCYKRPSVDNPTTRLTVSPSAILVTNDRLTLSAAVDTASPTMSVAETKGHTTTATAPTVTVGTPSTATPPYVTGVTATALPPLPETHVPIATPPYVTAGPPTAAPPGRRKKRAVKETQCVANAMCVPSSDVYMCRCQTGYTADKNIAYSMDSGAAPITESRLSFNITCVYFIMLMYVASCF